ncbi:MAG: OmpP1/FadL family transporter [Prevotella sp.]
MRNIFLSAAALCLVVSVSAQETYDNTSLLNKDLNGTARYVGMGGAMEALGADISTISSNPAGIGLFRRSVVSGSLGVVSQPEAKSFRNADKTNMSFDQIGFVYSTKLMGRNNGLNFAFNYHKSKNFDYILSTSDRLNNASQSKLSYLKGYTGVFNPKPNSNGTIIAEDVYGNPSLSFNQLDYLYYNTVLTDADGVYRYNNANGYMFDRGNTGYIGEYNFNISGNVNDRFYWGITAGLHDVHYKGVSSYTETLVNENGTSVGNTTIDDERKITGTGFDAKFGVIFRPVADSPFRVGLYVNTPIWYDLKTSNYTSINNGSSVGMYDKGQINEVYDFKLRTPWVFGVSLGHTVGNFLALGATYEYSDYGTTDTRINDGDYYDWYWDEYYETSSRDEVMKSHTERTLKGVHTLKLGAEYKFADAFSLRLGYNYISSMYEKDGFKDGTLDSYGSYYSSSTDYTNWDSTNRFTVGFGYNYRKWNFDLAYVYTQTKGDFYPFMSYYPSASEDAALENIANGVKVNNKRDQLLMTVSYRF